MRMLYLLLTVLLISPAFAQNAYRVQRGERPVIDLQSVPDNAYYKGMIKIKLNESFTRQLDESPASVDADGIVRFGIAGIDNLNEQFSIGSFDKPFNSPAFSSKFAERHRAWGFHLWYKLYFDESMDVKAIIQAYSALGEVLIAEPEYIKVLVTQDKPILYTPESASVKAVNWTPDDPRYNEQWHYNNTGQQNGTPDADIDLPEAWEITKGNPAVIVAIVDGGINYTHNDIAPNMWPGIGYNFVTNSPNISTHDHGTHVAGTVAAVSNNAVGVAGVAGGTGAGDGVRLMSCQVFTTSSSGGFENAPVWAADNGACISQNSWGYTSAGYFDQNVLDAIDYFNTNGGGEAMVDGGITIFAAGNGDSQGQWYPGCYSGCFSVAGLTNQDKKAWYSNYDSWVDVAAPGGETDAVTEKGVLSTLPNNSYGFYQGTSMACPHVSGLAALIASLAYGQFTPQQVADIIKNTTDDIYALNPGFIGQLGSGRINAFAALTEAQDQMILVNNPLAFSALAASNSQINLNWVKSPENDDVMIAYAMTNLLGFGDPVQTQSYQVGDTIEGGGIIIYKGSATTFNHTELSSNTPYFYKAWSLNGVPEYSRGLEATSTTLKEPITIFPYHESFDNETFPPVNWESKQQTGTGLWDRQTAGTNPSCLPQSGDGMARFNSNVFATGTSGILVTPPVIFAADQYETSLWVYRDNEMAANTDKVEVYANLAPNSGFATLLGTIFRSRELAPVEPEAGWYQYTFEIPATYQNKLTYLIFKGISNQGNNLFVDDVQIQLTVTCFPPSGLAVADVTSNSANVSWTGIAPATAWDVEYGPTGFTPGSGTMIMGVSNQFVDLMALESNTTYDAYVRGDCATDETSSWTGPIAFTTLCSAAAPWDETFEAMNNSFDCWQVMRNTSADGGLNGNNLMTVESNSWFICNPDSFEGNGATYIYNGLRSAAIHADAADFNWLISGEINLPESGKTDLSFWLNYTNTPSEVTRFHVNLFSGNTWSTLLSQNDASAMTNNFSMPVVLNMDAYNGQTIRLAFVFEQSNGQPLSVDNITLKPATNYWTGVMNTSLNETANWRVEVPQPGSEMHIHAAPNQPLIDQEFEWAGNITIHSGAVLTLSPAARVTLTGELINQAGTEGLVLKNSGSSVASLIHQSENVAATVQHSGDIVSGLHQWRLLSSPVTGQSITPDFVRVPQAPGDVLVKWDETTASWIDSRMTNGDWNPVFENDFLPGRAYMNAFGIAGLRSFKGQLSSGSVESESITHTGGPEGGWHLIGNPYTSCYIWNPSYTFLAKTAKVWNDQGSSYIDVYPGSIIPSMTGLWVQNVDQLPASVTFSPDNRTHEPANAIGPDGEYIQITVTETMNNTFQTTVIRKETMAAEGFDQLYDAHFLAGYAPQFYSLAGEEKLSTNSLPSLQSGRAVTLGFVKNDATDYSLAFQFPVLYPNMVVFLNDKKAGTMQDLSQNPSYSFTSADGDEANRFELLFGTVGLDENAGVSGLKVYANASTIYLQSIQPITGEVIVNGLTGKQLMRIRANGQNLMTVNGNHLAPGIYLVSVIGNNGVITSKVVLK